MDHSYCISLVIKQGFPLQNNLKNQDPSYKMGHSREEQPQFHSQINTIISVMYYISLAVVNTICVF